MHKENSHSPCPGSTRASSCRSGLGPRVRPEDGMDGSSIASSDLREFALHIEHRLTEIKLQLGSMIVALGGILIAIRYFG